MIEGKGSQSEAGANPPRSALSKIIPALAIMVLVFGAILAPNAFSQAHATESTPTPVATALDTASPTDSTATPTSSPTDTPSATPSDTPTTTPSATPSGTETPTPTPTVSQSTNTVDPTTSVTSPPAPTGAKYKLKGVGANHVTNMMGLVSNAQGLDDPIHGPYTMTVDSCAACHRAHTGKGPVLFKTTGSPQSTLCFTCHDGTGSQYNVKNAYQTAPVNDPATRTYYTHDATVATNHAISTEEFKGVLNRHTECSDCHNPHSSTATLSTQAVTGWTPSGRMLGVPGVAVVNHAAGTTPDYTYLDGTITPTTAEYQLCFKCHSSYTNLPSNTGFTQSQYLLDKAVEFNPSNLSFHPVEAQGTNQTTKMAASLSGTSAYKIWNFTTTSTIRCSNCHAPSAKTGSGAGQTLDTHTSANAGILLLPYRDRILKASTESYKAVDSALCYACHTDVPFKQETSTGTNFMYHFKHVSAIAGANGSGPTASIDTPGAGKGDAICAECHYRLHSTTYALTGQTSDGKRLVNFSPNVLPRNGVIKFTSTSTGHGTCTLVCHGKSHNAQPY